MRILIYVIIIVLIFSIIAIVKLEKNEVKYVKSDVDGKEYPVRDLPDKQDAADMLATIKQNMMKLVDYLYEHKDTTFVKDKKYIEQLKNRIRGVVINESSEDSMYTSYSVNKGEQIVFCLRSKYNNQLHDLNLIMYVALHEMSHVSSSNFGHDKLFKHIFALFTKVAIEIGIYKKINFNEDPTEYCGLMISESII